MATVTVCLILLLLSGPCWTSMVRRMGCMVKTGNEVAVIKERLTGQRFKPHRASEELRQQTGLFSLALEDSETLTVHSCVQLCWRMRYSYAALQDGSKCLCGNSLEGLAPVDETLCHERCSGNCKQRCGGRAVLSVFATGYEVGPTLHVVDLYKGLVGCYPKTSWKDFCGPPPPVMTFDKQHLRPRDPEPLDTGGSASLPPDTSQLVSVRMSALLCATYCVSLPRPKPVAVLQAPDTCCCGHNLTNPGVQRESQKVDFALYCSEPCADPASSPRCVGEVDDRRYISVYNTFAIWPVPSARPGPWEHNASWLQPIFPAHDNFEVSSFSGKWSPPVQEELSGVNIFPPDNPSAVPIVDEANLAPWVLVVDDPEEDRADAALVWIILAVIVLFCLLLFLAIIIILIRRKKKQAEGDISTRGYEGSEAAELPKKHAEMGTKETRPSDLGTSGSPRTAMRGTNNATSERDNTGNNAIMNEADWSDSETSCNESETYHLL